MCKLISLSSFLQFTTAGAYKRVNITSICKFQAMISIKPFGCDRYSLTVLLSLSLVYSSWLVIVPSCYCFCHVCQLLETLADLSAYGSL